MTKYKRQCILVTGASGFLGEHLCRFLSRRSVQVIGTWLNHRIDLPGVSCIPLDLTDPDSVSRLVRDSRPDAVIHCAAMSGPVQCFKEPDAARASIVSATGNIASALCEWSPETPLITVSTDLVFDGKEPPYSPDSPTKPLSNYGSLKLEAEQITLGMSAGCVARTSLMFASPATHSGGFLAWMMATLIRQEKLTLYRDEVRTPVHCDDVSEVLGFLAMNPEKGIWHAGGPQSLSRHEMGVILCEKLEVSPDHLVASSISEASPSPPRPPDVSLNSEVTWKKIRHQPRTFADGLDEFTKKLK